MVYAPDNFLSLTRLFPVIIEMQPICQNLFRFILNFVSLFYVCQRSGPSVAAVFLILKKELTAKKEIFRV